MREDHVKPKVYHYTNSVQWHGTTRGALIADGRPDVEVGTPPDFGGDGGVWAPEDFIVAALNACVMSTFLYFAQRMGVPLAAYESRAEGRLEFRPDGGSFTAFTVRPTISVTGGPESIEQAKRATERAQDCVISRSLSAEVTIGPEFRQESA